MSVKDKVKEIVQGIEGLSFEYNNWQVANVKLDNAELPTCLFLLPVSGNLNLHNGRFRDNPNCLIGFLDKVEADSNKKNRGSFDFEGEENDPTVERMKVYAKKFIAAVNQSRQFKPVEGDFHYSVVYDMLDVNLTGIVLEVELKEEPGECIE